MPPAREHLRGCNLDDFDNLHSHESNSRVFKHWFLMPICPFSLLHETVRYEGTIHEAPVIGLSAHRMLRGRAARCRISTWIRPYSLVGNCCN